MKDAGFGAWALLALAWMAGTFGGGWVLAWLYKRLYPDLAFYKLWATWSAVLAGIVALLFVFGVVGI